VQLSITHAPMIAQGIAANMAGLDQSVVRDTGILDYSRLHGMTLQAVFEATGIPVSTLHGFKNLDAEPKHADGDRLLALWQHRMHPPVPRITGSIRQERVSRR
jgi:hypothetical protein